MSLPSGYKRLEYIQSSGTQKIDTGFKPNNNTKITADAEYISSDGTYPALFGARNRGSQQFWLFWGGRAFISRYNTSDITVEATLTDRHQFTLNKNVLSIDGSSATGATATFQSNYNAYLFSVNASGTTSYYCKARLYSCQIYDNDVLVRDFVPCINASGEVGLYDLVGKQFYGNAGTGTFKAGPVIAIAIDKSEITELEYIQGSGTQYINTGIMPNQDTRLDLQASFAQTGSHTIVGADLGWTANGFSIGVGFAHYGTETSNINGMNDGLMHLISMDKNTLSVDGVSVHAFSAQKFSVGYPLVLFANNRSGSIEEITTMTLCSSQIYDNGTIVRNYIPCQTTSGEIGLWDALNKMFYRNAGTGTFVGGPIKANSLNLRVNIGGAWKDANEAFVNIGGTWKTVEAAFVNIDGTWKELG